MRGFKIILSAAIAFLMITSCTASKLENTSSPGDKKLVSSEGEKGEIRPDLGAEGKDYIPGEVLVKFKEGVSEESIMAISKKFSLIFIEKVKGTSIYRFGLPGDKAVPEAVDILKQQNEVKTAQPNYIYRFNQTGEGIKIR
jgi:hypothetical protein